MGCSRPTPDVLGSLSDELRRLRRLADDLSSLSRVQEQGLGLHPVDADLAELARRAAARLAPQFRDAQVGTDRRCRPGGPGQGRSGTGSCRC